MAEAARAGGGTGEIPFGFRDIDWLGDVVCAREGGGGGAAGCVDSAPAYSSILRHNKSAFVIKAYLSVHPPLEFLVIYKATFLSEGGFDWAFFIPPTTEPTGWLMTGF
jgi:hypothetical protein